MDNDVGVREVVMNGYEILYESYRYYPDRPESSVAKDFVKDVDWIHFIIFRSDGTVAVRYGHAIG